MEPYHWLRVNCLKKPSLITMTLKIHIFEDNKLARPQRYYSIHEKNHVWILGILSKDPFSPQKHKNLENLRKFACVAVWYGTPVNFFLLQSIHWMIFGLKHVKLHQVIYFLSFYCVTGGFRTLKILPFFIFTYNSDDQSNLLDATHIWKIWYLLDWWLFMRHLSEIINRGGHSCVLYWKSCIRFHFFLEK